MSINSYCIWGSSCIFFGCLTWLCLHRYGLVGPYVGPGSGLVGFPNSIVVDVVYGSGAVVSDRLYLCDNGRYYNMGGSLNLGPLEGTWSRGASLVVKDLGRCEVSCWDGKGIPVCGNCCGGIHDVRFHDDSWRF